ncbi:MAG: hypothetical protein K5681_04020 [Treponema sp.]|nr:hypothetical protein [Treponema sp.]
MKKTFLIFTCACLGSLFLTSCADGLNESLPEASYVLSDYTGVNYGETSEVSSGSSSSSSSSIISTSVNGELEYGSDEDIYYFYSSSEQTDYTIKWTNYDGDKVEVSLSKYPSFSSCVFEDDSSGSHSIRTKKKMKVYIKVKPYCGYSWYAGEYKLTVSGGSETLTLYKYN